MDMASLVQKKKNPKIPALTSGDTVKVSARIVEGGKERIQVFQGVIIKVRGGGTASFTVRHVASGIGVERTFLFDSPLVEKVEVVRHGKVRRSRLYYLRNLSGKEARRKIKRVERKVEAIGEEVIPAEPEEVVEPIMEAEAAPEAEAPAAEETVAEEPVAEEEKAPEAVAEAPEEPVAEEPAAEAPAAEEEKPAEAAAEVADEPVAEAPAEEPAAEAPAAEEPVAEDEKAPEAEAAEAPEEENKEEAS